jgi:hypothetical protein
MKTTLKVVSSQAGLSIADIGNWKKAGLNRIVKIQFAAHVLLSVKQ